LLCVHEDNAIAAAKMAVNVLIGFGFNCFMPTNVSDEEGRGKRITEAPFSILGLFAFSKERSGAKDT
jgi:hypothetical protein